MEKQAWLAKIGIEGIQKYICSTGKLKEMIGGSAIINYITTREFYEPLLAGLTEDDLGCGRPDTYSVAQANAGTIMLILFDADRAREFLFAGSSALLARFPGLPFYAALEEFTWSDSPEGWEEYMAARARLDQAINEQRGLAPVSAGAPLLPILRPSRLDGLPAVDDDDGLLSLPSQARRDPAMRQRAREELRRLVDAPPGIRLEWKEDLEDLLAGEQNRAALICMDGNDLGKLFGGALRASAGRGLCENLKDLKDLSSLVKKCNESAFSHACGKIAEYEMRRHALTHPGKQLQALVMPLRPLVMGGDDITVIARADIALAFVQLFAREFEKAGSSRGLSLGIGMVVMPSSYPFARAFPLAEALQDSAKKLTRDLPPGQRPSSLDYLVLTEDVERDLQEVRKRLYTGASGFALTTKPFDLRREPLAKLMRDGCEVLTSLPRSQIRQAWTVCRQGPEAAKPSWNNLRENIARNLGGRRGSLMSLDRFLEIFPENFFFTGSAGATTVLGDYLELARVTPDSPEVRAALLEILEAEETAGVKKDV